MKKSVEKKETKAKMSKKGPNSKKSVGRPKK